MGHLFDYILLAMAGYVLYCGIKGTGKLFEVDNIKEGREEHFKKVARPLYIILGIVMVLNSSTTLLLTALYTYDENYQLTVPTMELGQWSFLTPTLLKTLSYVFLALVMVMLVVLMVFMGKNTDRNAPPKKKGSSANQGGKPSGTVLPSHAFEFDAEEPKND